jgi:hypothetical protein
MTDTTAMAALQEPTAHRFRGRNKQPAWRRDQDAPVSVIRLPLVVDDPHTRRRVERLFFAMWQLKRALQRDARARVDAYWAGNHRRQRDTKTWRAELGLTRESLERAAYRHLADSGWLPHHATKALAMHQADEVWNAVARHLFPDQSGRRAGPPKVGRWWEYTRIPGRARRHTRERKWETFRLHGSLAGHLAAHHHPALDENVSTAEAAAHPPETSVLAQPWHLPTPTVPRPSAWWDYRGPLAVVFPGRPAGIQDDIVLPVRLPQGAGRWPYLRHYLDRPELWHKIDLVRHQDTSRPGGWTYEAHLLILDTGYASPATQARRAQAARLNRTGGVDGNVSNLSVVSLPATLDPTDGPVLASRVVSTEEERTNLARERRRAKGRERALKRSRRNSNRDQYRLSKRQQQRAERRQQAGLAERSVEVPKGPRVANVAGVPKRAYRHDRLSNRYRHLRATHARAAASTTQAKLHRARAAAAQLVADHGARLTVEDTDIRAWFRLWGKACATFTPGMLIAALDRECASVPGGRLLRASTTATAWSQHCLCGARIAKSLRDRAHV